MKNLAQQTQEYEEFKDILQENSFKKLNIAKIQRKLKWGEICENNLTVGKENQEIMFIFELKQLVDKHPLFQGCKSLNDYEEVLD